MISRLLFLVGIAFCTWAQTTPSKQLDLYATAIDKGSAKMAREYGHLKPSPLEDREPTDYRNLLVDKSTSVPADYPNSSADGTRFSFLTSEEMLARRKALKRDFSFLVVEPARLEGPKIKVIVTVYWAGIAQGQLEMALSDWAIVYFRLDPIAHEFVFDSVKLGGI